MRVLLALVLVVGLGSVAEAQTRVFSAVAACGAASDVTLSSNGDSFTCGVSGYASARLQTLDSYSGTWEVQCSVDGSTFDEDDEVPVTLVGATASAANVTDVVGIWDVNVAGCSAIKVIATAGFAATDTTFAVRALATGGGSAGAGAAGAVTQGTDPWLVGGTGATYLGKAEDAAHTTADTGVAMLGVVSATTPTATSATAGDYAVPNLDANGRMYVNATLYSAAGSAVSVATDATHDSAASATGPQIMGGGKNTTLPTAVTDGDAVRLLTDLYGRLQPKNICENPELVSSVVISTATSGNVQLVALSGSTVVTVCGFNVVATGTVAVQFISGTGAACATGETDKTGAMPFVANGGINTGFGDKIFAGAAGEAVCIELSAAIQVDGVLTYVQQ